MRQQSIFKPRSFCPLCHASLAWYDIIPVVSWFLLRGKCRRCLAPISPLYPFIELLTATTLTALWLHTDLQYFFAYFLFFSALIVSIRSDLETMLLSRFVTMFAVPVGVFLSLIHALPISPINSILGATLGYGFLYLLGRFFYRLTHTQGIGEGDLELLAFIGSFIGVYGMWISLTIGSTIGSLISVTYLLTTPQPLRFGIKIPFGPFLAFGAIMYVLFTQQLHTLLF